jgi:hypothetical protein
MLYVFDANDTGQEQQHGPLLCDMSPMITSAWEAMRGEQRGPNIQRSTGFWCGADLALCLLQFFLKISE